MVIDGYTSEGWKGSRSDGTMYEVEIQHCTLDEIGWLYRALERKRRRMTRSGGEPLEYMICLVNDNLPKEKQAEFTNKVDTFLPGDRHP